MVHSQEGKEDDDDQDEDEPRASVVEGRVEKYIGVKVKACIIVNNVYFHPKAAKFKFGLA